MNIIEVFDTTYQFEKFENIFLSGNLVYERNKFGIVRLVPNFRYKKLIFIPDKTNNYFTVDNCTNEWSLRDDMNSITGITGNEKMNGAEYMNTSSDTKQGHSIMGFLEQITKLPTNKNNNQNSNNTSEY